MATAFCIYSETDKSLNFYNRDTIPAVIEIVKNNKL